MEQHEVVSRFEWLRSRRELLRKEKEFTRLRDELTETRRRFPWEPVDKSYVFEDPEAPGLSVFFKGQAEVIFHTYSCYARGLDMINGTYQLLDLVPKGRDEASMEYTQAWVRHHDRYEA